MKIASLIISGISIIGMIVTILVKPTIKIKNKSFQTFYIFPLLGAIILLFVNINSSNEILGELVSNKGINPLEIIGLFFSMVFISTVLDEVGFFSYLANKAIMVAHKSQKVLFFILTLLTALLTIFTSNDIIIITFTPFIIFFSKRAKISPIPFLVSEFVSANTWSMLLLIGNPTNVFLAQSFSIDFFQYLKIMFIPTLLSGIGVTLLMYLIFRKSLSKEIEINQDDAKITNKPIFIASISILSICIVLITISSYINIPMWLISIILASILLIFLVIYVLIKKENKTILFDSLKRLPYTLIPLLLSMFIIVSSLNKNGVINDIASILNNDYPIITYGITSFISANLVNNIPMSVFFTKIIQCNEIINYQAIYASIIGSNVAAYLTPIGALAGIMWLSILKKEQVDFSFFSFTKYGLILAPSSLFLALLGLYISTLLFA